MNIAPITVANWKHQQYGNEACRHKDTVNELRWCRSKRTERIEEIAQRLEINDLEVERLTRIHEKKRMMNTKVNTVTWTRQHHLYILSSV